MGHDTNKKRDKKAEHIPGIYNYCDRWCERCPFTSRCLNFEMSEEKFGDLQSLDDSNEIFWKKLSETLQETLTMLQEMAEEKGIDLDALDIEEGDDFLEPTDDRSIVHIIAHIAQTYIDLVSDWFEVNIDPYIHWKDEPANNLDFDSDQTPNQDDVVKFTDSVEVIRWYQHQIYVKLRRAIHSTQYEELEILEDFPKDSDGSAKVALIGMDRSISAWGKILKYFPKQEDTILNIIAHLERLRKRTENEYPEARVFVRPGFDEISPNKD
ncbi:MAG: hypothetical protein PVF14_04350 [Desulfobacterales bacterium]|jgi:hypothetical protein